MEQIDNLPTVDIVKGDEERYMSLKEKYSMLAKGVIQNENTKTNKNRRF